MTPDIPRSIPIVIPTLRCLHGTSAMRGCVVFFMGISLCPPEDLLIPFIGTSLVSMSTLVIYHQLTSGGSPTSSLWTAGAYLQPVPGFEIHSPPLHSLLFQEARLIQRLRAAAILVVFTLLGARSGISQPEPLMLFHEVHPAMGSEFSIDLYAPNQETADQWMQLSFEEVDRIEVLLSNYRPSSELSRISREAGTHPVTTDPETFDFLQTALSWSRRSNGAFDITVGPLMRAWGFFFNHGRIPPEVELLALKKQTGWTNIHLDATTRTVSFINRTSMELDPGGIGKGYAVDRIVALLRQQHVSAALISAGSSTIYAISAPPGSRGWPINIADPAHAGSTLSTILLADTSLSTSACTEKFFIKDGHRYCHILDPHTMHPIENMLQTTVIAPSATDSDALSTATFVMGPDASARLLQSCPQTEAVIVAGTPDSPRYHTIHWPNPLNTRNEAKQEKRALSR